MNKNDKSEMVSEVKEILENSSAVYLTDYSGIPVADINEIRNQFRKEGVKYKVFKNTLFERALKESGKYEKLADHLVGMTGYAFTTSENLIIPAKIIKKYFTDTQKLQLKACYIEDQYYDGSSLDELASLPSKKEIIASILASINSPISGVVGAINAVMRDLVSVIDQISQRQEAA
jgi:large subunit ribosomal protein L10